MMRIYQYFGWILFTPLSFILWGNLTNQQNAFLICLLPVLWAYILPGLGTNFFKVWSFNVRGKVGNFKLQHGFVFGSATALLSGLIYFVFIKLISNKEILFYSYIVFSVLFLTIINVYYDYLAIKKNIIFVYNKPWAQGKSPWDITKDYAIHIFGLFFLLYVPVILIIIEKDLNVKENWFFTLICLLSLLLIPVICFNVHSKIRHGVWGLFPVKAEVEGVKTLEEYLKDDHD